MRSCFLSLATIAVLAVATVLTASPVHAATTVSFSGGVLTATLGSGSHFQISPDYTDSRIHTVQDYNHEITSMPGCSLDAYGSQWTCVGITQVKVTGSSGDDHFSVEGDFVVEARLGAGNDTLSATENRKVTAYGDAGNDDLDVTVYDQTNFAGSHLDGGDGNDRIWGGPGDDTIVGGAGNDMLAGEEGHDTIQGGDGQDQLFGDNGNADNREGDGNDVLEGGDGDDLLTGSGGSDTFRGGPGNDTVSYKYTYDYGINRIFSASLDGMANDGEAGEKDNIDADGSIENITLPGYGDWTTLMVTGNDVANVIEGTPNGVLTLDARGGDDNIVVGSGGSGSSRNVLGGAGNDTISAWGPGVKIDGGPGNDTLTGDDGNDIIVGGPGRDSINGKKGNDTVDTVDSEVDSIECGEGADILRADALDVYSFACESVTVVAAPTPEPSPTPTPTPTRTPSPTPTPTPPPGPEPTPTSTPIPPPGPEPTPTLTPAPPPVPAAGKVTYKVAKKIKVNRKGVFKIRATNTYQRKVKIRTVGKSAKPKMTVAKTTTKVRAKKHGVIKLKLSKKALRTLKTKKRLKITLVFKVTSGGKGTTIRRTILLRR